jgi:hypothetical protein
MSKGDEVFTLGYPLIEIQGAETKGDLRDGKFSNRT